MKKTYETPALQVVEIRYNAHLLTGSGESSRGIEISGYDASNDNDGFEQ